MRLAFTIGLNCKHHLLHNDFYKKMLDMFDYWVFIEGASGNSGSTKWCKQMPSKWHDNGRSIDGTVGELMNIQDYSDAILRSFPYRTGKMWDSKDEMVNSAIDLIKDRYNNGFLWQVDADEQWKLEDLEAAEKQLAESGRKCGAFHARHYVGKDLIAVGDWGGNLFKRLWQWNGERFLSHEPPTLLGMEHDDQYVLPQTFDHYGYYFEQDVKFKSEWYSGHEHVYENWKKLQEETSFPKPISYLFGDSKFSKLNSQIVRV